MRNIEKSAVPRMKPATFAPATVLVRRMPKRISGSVWRSSQATKPVSRASATAAKATVFPASQPSCPACVMA